MAAPLSPRGLLGQTWTFEQTVASGAAKKIELRGYAAPFGRPRQRPVIKEEFSVRHHETRYPGFNGPPTRHFFGTRWGDAAAVLSGRWTDRDLGLGGTEQMISNWQSFIGDQRECLIHWGSIVTYTGFVEKLSIGRESATEVNWTLNLLIDNKDLADVIAVDDHHDVKDTMKDIDDLTIVGLGSLPKRLPSLDALTGELVDQVDDLVSSMNQAGALVVRLGNTLTNLSEATFNEVERLRAGGRQFRTAFVKLSTTVDSIGDNALLLDRQAEDDLSWMLFSRVAKVQEKRVLLSLADMEDSLDRANGGTPGSVYRARGGDSWESISTHFFGGPGSADAIRAANGIRFAEQPVAGRTYQIPDV